MAAEQDQQDSDEEINRILDAKDAKNTKKSTKFAVRVFHGAIEDVEKAEENIESLDKSLAKFFANAKKKTGRNTKLVLYKH
jgi:uncharacterized membrane protein YkvA (DUF1232 family)